MSFLSVNYKAANQKGSEYVKPSRSSNVNPYSTSTVEKNTPYDQTIISLQSAVGNQSMQRLRSNNLTSIDFPNTCILRPKLKISQVQDAYEEEADMLADQVMKMSIIDSTPIMRSTKEEGIDRKCAACQKREEEEKLLKVSQKPSSTTSNSYTSDELSNEINIFRSSSSSPLDVSTKGFMESRFGYDFSNVRIHIGEMAAKSAKSVDARAYTIGNDIVFDNGQYAPNTLEGRRLLAHELTHVLQQSSDTLSLSRTGTTHSDASEINPSQHGSVIAVLQQSHEQTLFRQQQPAEAQETDQQEISIQNETSVDTLSADLPPELVRRIHYAATILKNAEPLSEDQEKQLVKSIGAAPIWAQIHEKRRMTSVIEQINNNIMRIKPEHGVPLPDSPEAIELESLSQELDWNTKNLEILNSSIEASLMELGIPSEEDLIQFVEVDYPRLFLDRAKEIAFMMLSENKRVAELERERYSEQVCSPDIDGLLSADQKLLPIYDEIKRLEISINTAHHYMPYYLPAAGMPTPENIPEEAQSSVIDIQNLAENQERLPKKQDEFNIQRAISGKDYPILFSPRYRPGMFAEAAPEELANVVGGPIDEILGNISKVEEAIHDNELKIWNVPDIIEIVKLDMGVEENEILSHMVESHIGKQQEDERFWQLFKAAVALVTTVIAFMIPVVGPALGTLVGLAWGTEALITSTREYRLESAAELTALDPAIADISINEPTLKWIILDIAFLGLDAAPVIRGLRPFARALTVSRSAEDFAAFARAVRSVLDPESAQALIRRVGRRFGKDTKEEAAIAAREAVERGADAALEIPKVGVRARIPGLVGCRVGSLFCPIDFLKQEFADLFEARRMAEFAQYIRETPNLDLSLGRSLRRSHTILTGNDMYAQYMREVSPSLWSEPFREAQGLAQSGRIRYRVIGTPEGQRFRWPLDDLDAPWPVHHDPPLSWIDRESNRWWHPMPYRMHDAAHKWWSKIESRVRRLVREGAPRSEWDKILEEGGDIRNY